jgi:hypothetical protein
MAHNSQLTIISVRIASNPLTLFSLLSSLKSSNQSPWAAAPPKTLLTLLCTLTTAFTSLWTVTRWRATPTHAMSLGLLTRFWFRDNINSSTATPRSHASQKKLPVMMRNPTNALCITLRSSLEIFERRTRHGLSSANMLLWWWIDVGELMLVNCWLWCGVYWFIMADDGINQAGLDTDLRFDSSFEFRDSFNSLR